MHKIFMRFTLKHRSICGYAVRLYSAAADNSTVLALHMLQWQRNLKDSDFLPRQS